MKGRSSTGKEKGGQEPAELQSWGGAAKERFSLLTPVGKVSRGGLKGRWASWQSLSITKAVKQVGCGEPFFICCL